MNPKYFYSYAKKKLKVKAKIGPLENEKGQLVDQLYEMTNLLQHQYTTVYSTPLHNSTIVSPEVFFHSWDSRWNKLDGYSINARKYHNSYKWPKNNESPGPDVISAVLLKECKNELATLIYLLWRKSLNSGENPSCLKELWVIPIFKSGSIQLERKMGVPIFKSGSRAAPKNYRPVIFTLHLIKIFERVLKE